MLQKASGQPVRQYLEPLPTFGFKLRRTMAGAYTDGADTQQVGQGGQYVLFLTVGVYDMWLEVQHELPELAQDGKTAQVRLIQYRNGDTGFVQLLLQTAWVHHGNMQLTVLMQLGEQGIGLHLRPGPQVTRNHMHHPPVWLIHNA